MPPPRALERGHSVRQYPTHVPDPLSSFAHAVWRFLLRRAAGRYAEHDLRAFHWLCYLLGQPRFSESFSRGAPRGSLWARQGPSFRPASWSHRVPDRHYHRGTLEASQSNFDLACGGRRAAASSRTSAAISA